MKKIPTVLVLLAFVAALPAGEGGELDSLAKKLEHFDYKERLEAVDEIAAIGGEKAAKLLTGALKDEDWEVQIRALRALGELSVPDTCQDVARMVIEGEIILVRQAAVAAVKQMGVEGIYDLLLKSVARGRDETHKLRALAAAKGLAGPGHVTSLAPFTADREPKVRAAAYRALGATGSPEAEKYLLRGLKDKTITARVGAAAGLGGLGASADQDAMKGILGLVLTEPDPYVLERAARAFRRFDPDASVSFLAEAAAQQRKPELRARAVHLLSELRNTAAGPPLIPFLDDPVPEVRAFAARGIAYAGRSDAFGKLEELLKSDPDTTVRRMALEAMVALTPGTEFRLPILTAALENDAPEIKVRACVLIEREKDPAALRAVYPLVEDPRWRVATAALITIGRLGHVDEIPVVMPRIGDRDWKIRAAAVEALGQLRHIDVIPHLIQALEDRDPIVKSAAMKNLEVLSQQKLGDDPRRWWDWYEEVKDTLEITKKGYRETVDDDYYGKSKYLIEILNKAQIVCVLGKWDHVEIVLEHLGIAHTVIRPQEITDVGLNPKQLLLINCEGTIGKKESIERLQWFVHTGGYLMATDWALTNAIVRAFPGYVNMDSKSKTGNDVVEIEPANPDDPLLRGVFDRSTMLRWWLEVVAFPMRVDDPFRTRVLVDSLEMLAKYGASSMAAAFDYGHGMVEQCVSHFYLQEEGLTNLTTTKERKTFAADSLGISLEQIRQLEAKGFFDGQVTEALTKEIAEDYSMFKLIVNFVVEKRKQVEQD